MLEISTVLAASEWNDRLQIDAHEYILEGEKNRVEKVY